MRGGETMKRMAEASAVVRYITTEATASGLILCR